MVASRGSGGRERRIARSAAGPDRDCRDGYPAPAPFPYSVCLKNSPSFLFLVFFSHVDDRPVFPPTLPSAPSDAFTPKKWKRGRTPPPASLLITFSGIDPSWDGHPSHFGQCACFLLFALRGDQIKVFFRPPFRRGKKGRAVKQKAEDKTGTCIRLRSVGLVWRTLAVRRYFTVRTAQASLPLASPVQCATGCCIAPKVFRLPTPGFTNNFHSPTFNTRVQIKYLFDRRKKAWRIRNFFDTHIMCPGTHPSVDKFQTGNPPWREKSHSLRV